MKDTIKLLRIPFSFYLMPVFFFALSQSPPVVLFPVILLFLALHLFIYPASNGYNSYMDQDETSVGGLKNPPKPTKQLLYAAMLCDLTGLIMSLIISKAVFIGVLCYVILSRMYSSRKIRIKKYPYLSFLIVSVCQGALIYLITKLSANNSLIGHNDILLMVTSSLLIGANYPLTQIYQHEEDYKNGDLTISYKLGLKGTFIFSGALFLLANILFFIAAGSDLRSFILFQVFSIPVMVFFIRWFLKVRKDPKEASFENSMKMNKTGSFCMVICFIILLLFKTPIWETLFR